jgi:hypothetical protein
MSTDCPKSNQKEYTPYSNLKLIHTASKKTVIRRNEISEPFKNNILHNFETSGITEIGL